MLKSENISRVRASPRDSGTCVANTVHREESKNVVLDASIVIVLLESSVDCLGNISDLHVGVSTSILVLERVSDGPLPRASGPSVAARSLPSDEMGRE